MSRQPSGITHNENEKALIYSVENWLQVCGRLAAGSFQRRGVDSFVVKKKIVFLSLFVFFWCHMLCLSEYHAQMGGGTETGHGGYGIEREIRMEKNILYVI